MVVSPVHDWSKSKLYLSYNNSVVFSRVFVQATLRLGFVAMVALGQVIARLTLDSCDLPVITECLYDVEWQWPMEAFSVDSLYKLTHLTFLIINSSLKHFTHFHDHSALTVILSPSLTSLDMTLPFSSWT